MPLNIFFTANVRKVFCGLSMTLLMVAMPSKASAMSDASWGDFAILSAIGSPLSAELVTRHASTLVDASCFKVDSSASDNPVLMDYTLTEPKAGLLRLWTIQPLRDQLHFTVTNQCQHVKRFFMISTDNQVQLEDLAQATSADVAQTAILERPQQKEAQASGDISALITQLTYLQQQLLQLQTQLNVSNQRYTEQSNAVKTLLKQIEVLSAENRWLQTLTLILTVCMMASSYFFADWLRRRMAVHGSFEAVALAAERAMAPSSGATTPAQIFAPNARFDAVEAAFINRSIQAQDALRQDQLQQAVDSTIHPPIKPAFMQHSNASIERLQAYLQREPKRSARVWLYVLDQLKKNGLQSEYERTANQCRKYFNVHIEGFSELRVARTMGLESFPRISQALQAQWGSAHILAFIDDLIFNTRDMPRIGFNRQIFEELLLLRDVAALTLDRSMAVAVEPVRSARTPKQKDANLQTLSQLAGEIDDLPQLVLSEYQYWSSFHFVLKDVPPQRKSA